MCNKLFFKANYVKYDDPLMKPVPTSSWEEFVDRPVAIRPVRSVLSLVKTTKKLFEKTYQTLHLGILKKIFKSIWDK